MAKKALVAVVVLALIIVLAVVVGGTLLNRGSNSNPTDGQDTVPHEGKYGAF